MAVRFDLIYFHIVDCLDTDQIETLTKFYKETENINEFKEAFSLEMSTFFCEYINNHHDQNRLCDEIGVFCLEGSIDLCKNNYGNPREHLLVYVENSSKFTVTDEKFFKLMEILKYILVNIHHQHPKHLDYSIKLVCEVINNFIKSIELPKDTNLDENDKKIFDHDVRVDRVLEFTNAYILFLDDFISRRFYGDYSTRKYVLSCLMNLFHVPFGFLNVEGVSKSLVVDDIRTKSIVSIDKNNEHDLDTMTIRVIKYLFEVVLKLTEDVFSLFNDYKINGLSNVAAAVLAYATYTNHVGGLELTKSSSHLPRVYSYVFIFEQVQPLILCLLEQDNHQFLIEKGLKLSYRLFKSVKLNGSYIDNKKFIDFCNSLFRLSIYTPFDSIRRLGGNLLNYILSRFEEINDRMEFLNYYLNSSLFNKKNDDTFNSYVYSFVIYLFKDELLSLPVNNKDSVSSRRQFERFCFKIFKLENAAECDLMKNSNKITSTLNLLRFILMMRNNFNKTSIISYINEESYYLRDIEKSVQLSKVHYELELKNVKNNNNEDKLDKKKPVEFKIENIKNGDAFDTNNQELSYEQKLDAMNISLNTIDMIESLRVRCVELIEN